MPRQKKLPKQNLNTARVGEVLSLILLGVLALRFLYFLAVYGAIYPHWDEWGFVPVEGGIFGYLFRFSNENMQFFTNMQFALVQYSGLPFKANNFISFGVYLWLIAQVYLYLREKVLPDYRWGLGLLFVSLFSDYMLDNLFWPLLSQSWFYVLFMILAVKFGFRANQDNRDRILAAVMIVLSVLAMNVSFIILFSVVYLLKNIYEAEGGDKRKIEGLFAVVWLLATMIILVLYFEGMRQFDKTVIDWSVIFSWAFYQRLAYFMMAPMMGFLLNPEMYWLYAILWLLLLICLAGLFVRQYKDKSLQGVWAIVLILGGNLAAVTLFRGDNVFALADHSGRYLIYSLLLIPAIYCVGCVDKNKYIRRISVGFCVIVSVFSLVGLFNGRHLDTIKRIENGKQCIEAYYEKNPQPGIYYCLSKFPKNIAPYLKKYQMILVK